MARSRHGIVSAEAADDLRAVQAALADAPAELRQLLADTAADQLSGAWADELWRADAQSPQQLKFVTYGARATPYAGGLIVSTGHPELGRPFEFGTKNPDKTATYYRKGSPKRRAHMVNKRHVSRQMPPFRKSGYVAYPAANRLGGRVFAMWVQLVHKVLHDATEGK